MPEKEVFIEITKPCFINGKPMAVGSIVKLAQKDAMYVAKGLDKARLTDAREEKVALVGAKKPAEPKKDK